MIIKKSASLLLCFFMVSCTEETIKKESPKPVKVITISASKTQIQREFPGKVIPTKKATLSFEVSGKLNQLTVLEGKLTKKGELLAAIVSRPYKNKYKKAKAKFDLAKSNFERGGKLVKKGFISQTDFDLLVTNKDMAEANLSTAKKELNDTSLYSPFEGIIVKKYVENFEFIKAKQPVFLLHDLEDIDIEIYIPEYIILKIKKERGNINPQVSFTGIKKTYPAKLKEFSSQADKTTLTYRTVFTLKAPEEINILPGMSVGLELTLPDYKIKEKSYHFIPVSAAFNNENNQAQVYVVNPNTHRVQAKVIKTGDMIDESIKVLSGIQEGQMIVAAGVHLLREGQKVKPLSEK